MEAAAATKAPQVSLSGAHNPAFAGTSFFLPDVGYIARPTFTDLDGDGDLDSFVGKRYGSTLFFLHTVSASAAAIAASTASGLPDVSTYALPTLADIDGDGDGDGDLDAFIGTNDGDNASSGALDLAAITDFSAGDRIQLKGAATHYRLLNSTSGGASVTLLQWRASSGAGTVDESIGFIQGLNTSTLSLTNSSQFLFVNPV
jgi:hypothetical protein